MESNMAPDKIMIDPVMTLSMLRLFDISLKYKIPQDTAKRVAVWEMGYATVIPIDAIAIKTNRLPALNKLPEITPATISLLIHLRDKNNNGIPIAKIDKLDEKNPDWSVCVACIGMTYEPPMMPDAAATRYPFRWTVEVFEALVTNGKPANSNPIAPIASII